MISRRVCAWSLIAASAHAHAQTVAVAPELWDRPRSAQAVLSAPAIKQAVIGYLAHPRARLVIHHGATQEASLQAEELRSWLSALAVEPQRIELLAGTKPGVSLSIEVVMPK